MTSTEFARAVRDVADTVTHYQNGGTADGGGCDCIGLVMAAMYKLGHKKYLLHGSNYFVRQQTDELHGTETGVRTGEVVYKARYQSDEGYDLADRYLPGGRYYNGDIRDFYHVGVVTCAEPLEITHCTGVAGGIKIDTKMGAWKWAGTVRGIDMTEDESIGAGLIEDEAQPDEGYMPIGMYTVTSPDGKPVRMRDKPSTSGKTMIKVAAGHQVEVLEGADGWCKIRYSGKTGYMMTQFLTYTGEPVTDDTQPIVEKNTVIERLDTIIALLREIVEVEG